MNAAPIHRAALDAGSAFCYVSGVSPTMWRFCNRRLFIAAGAIAASWALLILGWSSLFPKRLVNWDPAFHLTFCTITSGTNHLMFRGDKLLARLNEKLTTSGIHPITDARVYNLKSVEQGTLLGIGYRYDGDGQESDNLLTATVIEPGGTAMPLTKKVRSTGVAAPGEHLCLWLMPGEMTNLTACELRFTRRGKHVASVKLE
jgi:hypothetical protein